MTFLFSLVYLVSNLVGTKIDKMRVLIFYVRLNLMTFGQSNQNIGQTVTLL